MTLNRYSRNIACIGAESQKRLSASSVFIIGCGALGGQVAMLLAAAGVGKIGIADFDTIDITNLQRQLFFTEAETGKSKAAVLGRRLRELNSEIEVDVHERLIRRKDGAALLAGFDFIIDATDNPATKYMTDQICREIGRPGCIAGVSGWEGQLMCVTGNPSDGTATFSDVFPPPDEDPAMLPCQINGVIGPAASTIASLQAAEAIKYLSGVGEVLFDKLLTIDLSTMTINKFDL